MVCYLCVCVCVCGGGGGVWRGCVFVGGKEGECVCVCGVGGR